MRRHKSSTGMRGSIAKDVGPLQHTSHIRATPDSAHNESKHIEMHLAPHRLKSHRKELVQLPRPFERRPVPAGRNFGWWRQPERLFERA